MQPNSQTLANATSLDTVILKHLFAPAVLAGQEETVVNQNADLSAATEVFVLDQMYVLASQGLLEQGVSKVGSVPDSLKYKCLLF